MPAYQAYRTDDVKFSDSSDQYIHTLDYEDQTIVDDIQDGTEESHLDFSESKVADEATLLQLQLNKLSTADQIEVDRHIKKFRLGHDSLSIEEADHYTIRASIEPSNLLSARKDAVRDFQRIYESSLGEISALKEKHSPSNSPRKAQH